MGKSVNVILNSYACQSGDAQQATYYFNWSAVLDKTKKYYMHWTYLGGANVFSGASNKLPLVYITFNSNSYQILSTNSGAPGTQCIGFLKPLILVGSTNTVIFQAEDNTNLPIFMDCPPQSNTFTVSIRDATGALYLDNAGTPAKPSNYILNLRFTEVDEE